MGKKIKNLCIFIILNHSLQEQKNTFCQDLINTDSCMSYYFLDEQLSFPPVHHANTEGVLAIGGDLSVERLLLAYRQGIFPWFSDDEPIIWWSPDPRFVLYPPKLKVSQSMRQVLKREVFEISFDTDFASVVRECRQIRRRGQYGTWITDEVERAYTRLHEQGYAHSVEVRQGGQLVGGLYGVSLGSCFYGESMFSKVSNASKAGFITLVQKLVAKGFCLIDCQVHTQHLESLGGEYISRTDFVKELHSCLQAPTLQGAWTKAL